MQNENWQAELSLSLKNAGDKTYLDNNLHFGPLRVQKAFYPQLNDCHLYILHPPDGVVGGDKITITIDSDKNTQALFTSPGATKLYKTANGKTSHITQTIHAKEFANIEWLPQEVIAFDGAFSQVLIRFNISKTSKIMAWDIICLGRPQSDEMFEIGEIFSTFEIYQNNTIIFVDKIILNTKSINSSTMLRKNNAFGTFVITGSDIELEKVRNIITQNNSSDIEYGTTLIGDLIIIRVLSPHTFKIKDLFIKVWQELRKMVIGLEVNTPRIWAT